MSFTTQLLDGLKATTIIEWIAVSSSIIYVVLAAKRLILCWFFAFIGSLLFVYLCYMGQLYIEAILQFFYAVMALVGWFSWKHSGSDASLIKKWTANLHVRNILISGFLAFIIGFLFDNYTHQASPYIDAFTTCFSLCATYMVAQKILGNWLYWIAIDMVSIYLYAQRDYYLTAVQYALFTLLAVYGFWVWQQEYKRQKLC